MTVFGAIDLAAVPPDDGVEHLAHVLVGVERAEHGVDGVRADLVAALDQLDQLVDHLARRLDLLLIALERELVPAQAHGAFEPLAQRFEHAVVRPGHPGQLGGDLVRDVEDFLHGSQCRDGLRRRVVAGRLTPQAPAEARSRAGPSAGRRARRRPRRASTRAARRRGGSRRARSTGSRRRSRRQDRSSRGGVRGRGRGGAPSCAPRRCRARGPGTARRARRRPSRAGTRARSPPSAGSARRPRRRRATAKATTPSSSPRAVSPTVASVIPGHQRATLGVGAQLGQARSVVLGERPQHDPLAAQLHGARRASRGRAGSRPSRRRGPRSAA